MPPKIRKSRIEKHYQKLVLIFLIITLIIVGVIVYFSFSKTVIKIHPKINPQTANFLIQVSKIEEYSLEKSKTFDYGSETSEVPSKATGKVTIHNKYSKNQPLVERTRLLSSEGVLFRTKATINVPAGSSVEVEVEADLEGKSGNVGPGKFTIVALWPGIQDKIYGESSEAMTGGTKMAKIVTSENISRAKTELTEELKNELIKDNNLDKNNTFYSKEDCSSSAEPNSENANFEVACQVIALSPNLDYSEIKNSALEKMREGLGENEELYQPEQIDLKITAQNVNLAEKTATLKIIATGKTILKISSPIFDRAKLTNKDKHEINVYFSQFDDLIESVEIKFNPFWVVRSPQLVDHIEIELLKPQI